MIAPIPRLAMQLLLEREDPAPELVLLGRCAHHATHQPCQICGVCTTASGGGLLCPEHREELSHASR